MAQDSLSLPPTTAGIVDREGAGIYYETTGRGPAIIFVHGLGGNHLTWWQQVPYFASRYQCVTFAHRGFAPSPAADPDPAQFADDLAALIDHLQLRSVTLVAQSMGGWSCLDYALHYRKRVDRLVLSATAGTVAFATLGPHGEALEKQYAGQVAANQDLFRRGIHPAAGERMAREQPALHFLYREIDRLAGRIDKMALIARLAAMRTLPAERLRDLRMPVLFVAGAEDVVFPPAAAAALAEVVPGAQCVQVPESGHSVYFERAEVFNRLLDSFLRGESVTPSARRSSPGPSPS